MSKLPKMKPIKKVECHTVDDVRKVIRPYLSEVKSTKKELVTEIGGEKVIGEDGGSSAQEVLVEGFRLIKRRQEAFERLQEENLDGRLPLIGDINKSRFNVDTFIENSLGGKRVGLRIRWVVAEGTFEFDPLDRKFYQVDDEKKK